MSWIRFSKFIFRLYLPVFWHASLAIFLGCLTLLSGIGLIGTSAYLICYAALQPSIAELQVAIIGVRFFGLSRSVFRYLERINSHSVNLKMVSKLRQWFYERIEPLVPANTSRMATGDLLARAMHDIEILDQFFVRVIAPPLIACVVVIVTTLFLYTIHALLGWIALISPHRWRYFPVTHFASCSSKTVGQDRFSSRGSLLIFDQYRRRDIRSFDQRRPKIFQRTSA